MKKKFLYSASIALIMGSFASCSSDDGPDGPDGPGGSDDNGKTEWENPIPSATYTDASGMTLSVNGEPMAGKTAKIDVDANNPSAATITLSSTFNLSDIPDIPAELGDQAIAGPGVIPGSPVTVLDVTLKEGENGKATFAGSEETEYCTFAYSGEVTDSSFDLKISDVKLKNNSLVGLYRLLPYNVNEDWESEEYGTVYSEPVYVKWESTADLDFLGSPMKPADLVKLLMTMPLINDMTVRVPDMLCTLLKDVELCDDGNILANYADLNSNLESPDYKLSPANLAQYVVANENTMRFWLNPQAIMAATVRAEPVIDINNLLGNVIAQLSPMLEEGVPMRYKVDGANTTIYLDTEILLPLLKDNVVPLLRNEEVVNQLVELVSADESMGFIAALLPSMIESAANVIEGTTTLEIGLNLTTATE